MKNNSRYKGMHAKIMLLLDKAYLGYKDYRVKTAVLVKYMGQMEIKGQLKFLTTNTTQSSLKLPKGTTLSKRQLIKAPFQELSSEN